MWLRVLSLAIAAAALLSFRPARAQPDGYGTMGEVVPGVSLFGFPAVDEPLPCGLEAAYWRAARDFWFTRLADARETFDSVLYVLDTCAVAAAPQQRARVQLGLARVAQRGFNQRDAMRHVVDVLAAVDSARAPGLYAEALILEALLHEVSAQGEEALAAIARAGALVRTYHLHEARSTYFLRAASVERFYGDRTRAVRLADSALAAARLNGRLRDATDATFLRAVLPPDATYADRIAGFRAAADLYAAAGTTDGHGNMLANIARVYLREGRYPEAGALLDSALALLRRAEREGFDANLLYAGVYDSYGDLYRATERHDSAYAYYDRAQALRLDYAGDNRNADLLRLGRAADRARASARIAAARETAEEARRSERVLTAATVALLLFCVGLIVVVMLLARARQQVRTEVARQTVLRDELQHRVKNNFQVLITFLEAQANRAETPHEAGAFDAMARRVYNLAAIHAQLYDRDGVGGAEVVAYLRGLVEAFRGLVVEAGTPHVTVVGEARVLPSDYLSALGIILNELLTNSVKHAHTDTLSPVEVAVVIAVAADALVLRYAESARGRRTPPPETIAAFGNGGGMGAYLITAMAAQLEGAVAVVPGTCDTFVVEVTVPLPPGDEPAA